MSQANAPVPSNSGAERLLSTLDALKTCLILVEGIQSILKKHPEAKDIAPYSKIEQLLLNVQSDLQEQVKQVEPNLSEPAANLYRDDQIMNSCWFQLRVKIRTLLPD
ncbi:hypothetical protein [Trichocoleus sp. DQ-U1]|uniref:hypothetical protein n=1 Tax=Trichocoleus sp. DQ-U1 TaxID=2933926 RepID=UPI003299F1DE